MTHRSLSNEQPVSTVSSRCQIFETLRSQDTGTGRWYNWFVAVGEEDTFIGVVLQLIHQFNIHNIQRRHLLMLFLVETTLQLQED